MATILDTDGFFEDHDPMKQCMYCHDLVAQSKGSMSVGKCARHESIFAEDIASGFKQNRLKDLIEKSKKQ